MTRGMLGTTAVRESVEICGARLEYHRRQPTTDRKLGPVVLLHPWFGCWQFWRHTVDALPEFDTYAVNLYSLGAGAGWRDYASPEGLARAVVAMIESLGLAPCALMGNSMGGIAAQQLAATRPALIDKLVLVGTGARTVGVKPEFRRSLDKWITGGEDRDFTQRLVDALLARRPEDPHEFESFVEMVASANKAFMGTVLTNAFELDLRPVLPLITASTLIIRGALDAARTPVHVQEMHEEIRKSKAVEIPDAGHSPQVDSPQVFNALVRDFLLE